MLIQTLPPRLILRVIATRAASICRLVIQPRSTAFSPYSPKATLLPPLVSPRMRPRNCLRCLTRFGINISDHLHRVHDCHHCHLDRRRHQGRDRRRRHPPPPPPPGAPPPAPPAGAATASPGTAAATTRATATTAAATATGAT